jgi:hypothetical protein
MIRGATCTRPAAAAAAAILVHQAGHQAGHSGRMLTAGRDVIMLQTALLWCKGRVQRVDGQDGGRRRSM